MVLQQVTGTGSAGSFAVGLTVDPPLGLRAVLEVQSLDLASVVFAARDGDWGRAGATLPGKGPGEILDRKGKDLQQRLNRVLALADFDQPLHLAHRAVIAEI